MKAVIFIRGYSETPVTVTFRPTYLIITSESKKAKRLAAIKVMKEAAKLGIFFKKKSGRYIAKDVSLFNEKAEELCNII